MSSDYARFREFVRERRTVRAYRPEPIPLQLVEQAIEDACWAPSPHDTQPWRFALVSSDDGRRRLAEAMGERWREDLTADDTPEPFVEGQVKGSRVRLGKAQALVLVCLTQRDLDRYPDAPRQQAEHDMAVQSIGSAIQNLLLSLHLNGLGAAWMCAPLFCPDVVKAELGLPADWEPQALLTVGWRVHTPPTPPRRPVDGELLLSLLPEHVPGLIPRECSCQAAFARCLPSRFICNAAVRCGAFLPSPSTLKNDTVCVSCSD